MCCVMVLAIQNMHTKYQNINLEFKYIEVLSSGNLPVLIAMRKFQTKFLPTCALLRALLITLGKVS